MKIYTYATTIIGDDNTWVTSSKRFKTVMDCIDSLNQWLVCSYDIDFYPSVKIVIIEE